MNMRKYFLHCGILVGTFIVLGVYVLLFNPELWDFWDILQTSVLLYFFAMLHSVKDKDAEEKMSSKRG